MTIFTWSNSLLPKCSFHELPISFSKCPKSQCPNQSDNYLLEHTINYIYEKQIMNLFSFYNHFLNWMQPSFACFYSNKRSILQQLGFMVAFRRIFSLLAAFSIHFLLANAKISHTFSMFYLVFLNTFKWQFISYRVFFVLTPLSFPHIFHHR